MLFGKYYHLYIYIGSRLLLLYRAYEGSNNQVKERGRVCVCMVIYCRAPDYKT
jgi:hypothetical protein